MFMTAYTAELLNLEDVIITNVENIADQLHIYLELPRTPHTCPACGTSTDRVHDYRSRPSRIFLWAEIPFCIFVSGGIAAVAAKDSLKRILSFRAITV